jgi:hypothetical protein
VHEATPIAASVGRAAAALVTAGFGPRAAVAAAAAMARLQTDSHSDYLARPTVAATELLACPQVPLVHDVVTDADAASTASALRPVMAALSGVLQHLRGRIPNTPVDTTRSAQLSMLPRMPADTIQSNALPAALAHMLWAAPAGVRPQIHHGLLVLQRGMSSDDLWRGRDTCEAFALLHAPLIAAVEVSSRLSPPSFNNATAEHVFACEDTCRHAAIALWVECSSQAAIVAQAEVEAGKKPPEALSALEWSVAKVHLLRPDVGGAPHAIVAELHALFQGWLAASQRLIQAALQAGVGAQGLSRVSDGLLVSGALLDVVHVSVHNMHADLCTPEAMVEKHLGRAAALVHKLCQHASAVAVSGVSEEESTALTVTLSLAEKALHLDRESQNARDVRNKATGAPPPPVAIAAMAAAPLLACMQAGLQASPASLYALLSQLPLQLREAVTALLIGQQAFPSLGLVRLSSALTLRQKAVHALALCTAEAVATGGVPGTCDVLEDLGRLILEEVNTGLGNKRTPCRDAAVFACGTNVVAHAAQLPQAAAAAAAHMRLQAASVHVAKTVAAALAMTESGSAVSPLQLQSALSLAVSAATARSVSEAAQLKVLAWCLEQKEKVPAGRYRLPSGMILAAWLHWHAPSIPLVELPCTHGDLLPTSRHQQLLQLPPRAATYEIESSSAWLMHTATFSLLISPLASLSHMPLCEVHVHRAALAQAVHSVIAMHASRGAEASPPPAALVEASLLASLAAQTLVAAVNCGGRRMAWYACHFSAAATAAIGSHSPGEFRAAAARCTESVTHLSPVLKNSDVAPLVALPKALAMIAKLLCDVATSVDDQGPPSDITLSVCRDLEQTAAAGVCWAMLGAVRATLVLPPLTLDPVTEVLEAASLSRRAASHLFAPAVAAADLAGTLPLQPPVDTLRAKLLSQRDESVAVAAELSKNITPRIKPGMYPTVAARIHRFVDSLVVSAAAPSELEALQAAARLDAERNTSAATKAARSRAEAIRAWCEAVAANGGGDPAPEWHGFSDITVPVAEAAHEVARGLLLLCTVAAAASTIRDYRVAANVDITAALAAALRFPRSPSPPLTPSHSLNTPQASRAIACRAHSSAGHAEDCESAQRASNHLQQRAALSTLQHRALSALRHRKACSVKAALSALEVVSKAMQKAQEASRLEKELADSLYKQHAERYDLLWDRRACRACNYTESVNFKHPYVEGFLGLCTQSNALYSGTQVPSTPSYRLQDHW